MALVPSRKCAHDFGKRRAAALEHLRLPELSERVANDGGSEIGAAERRCDFLAKIQKGIGNDCYGGDSGFFELDGVMDTP
jgi:hypothetical protein